MSPRGTEPAARRPQQRSPTRTRVRGAQSKRAPAPAAELPIARVLVDVGLPHLDRPFDYLVTEDLADAAQPGCRVKVGFAGKEVGGYLAERLETSEHAGRLTPLKRLVSPVPVLTPEVFRLSRQIADRYAGVLSDVLRLAVPPRHARVEREWDDVVGSAASASDLSDRQGDPAAGEAGEPSGWSGYPAGEAFLSRLRRRASPRAIWTAIPGRDWTSALAEAVTATLDAGRGSIVCVPDHRDVDRLDGQIRRRLGPRADLAVTVTAELGPAARYRAFLRVLSGASRIVVGTRSAAFAPVRGLGLVALWDDGDDLHAEPRAPYPHAREVLALRAHLEETALLVGGFARTAEGQQLAGSGWAQPLVPRRGVLRAAAPRVHVTGDSAHELDRDPVARYARLPRRALEVARAALAEGPVLVQVPRAGYLAALACAQCRYPARCSDCRGPLALGKGQRFAGCRWCGRQAIDWRCRQCSADRFRAPAVGSQRTAEELGRAFPHVSVVSSSAGNVVDSIRAEPALVVATPGAEPVADGRYRAALILDTWLTLGRPDLRASEESLRRWLGAAALVRSSADGGTVVVVGDSTAAPIQSLVRWDPGGAAERELADRVSAGLPPATRVATATGPDDAVGEVIAEVFDALTADSPAEPPYSPPVASAAEAIGPVPLDEGTCRTILRVPLDRGSELAAALKRAKSMRSARKLPPVRVQIDPTELG